MKFIKIKSKIILLSIVSVLAILILIDVNVNATESGGIAKSITFTENMEGAYIYFRAVDAAGNVGEWSEPQRLWIDNTAPTVTANESSITITEGEVKALEDYFTVVTNGTNNDVSIVFIIEGTVYTTTETLTVEGSPYTVICTATKNGGKSASAEMEIVVEKAGPEPWDGIVATSFAGGTGTQTDPYLIETSQQLAYLASSTNSGTTYDGKYFKQTAELNLGGIQAEDGTWSGQNWTSIGIYTKPFMGIYDGNGYSISNIYCKKDNAYVGLFGFNSESELTGITIASGYIESIGSAESWIGGIVRCR